MAFNIKRFTGSLCNKLETEVCGETKYIFFHSRSLLGYDFLVQSHFSRNVDTGRIDKIMHYVKNFRFVYSYAMNKSGVQRSSITKEMFSIRTKCY